MRAELVNGDNATIVAGRVMPQRMVVMAGGELKLAKELYVEQLREARRAWASLVVL